MNAVELSNILDTLRINQSQAARLLDVDARTFRRWVGSPAEMTVSAAEALRAWYRLEQVGLSWRPDALPIAENTQEFRKQINLHREHAVALSAVFKRVEAQGGPLAIWEVALDKGTATLGHMQVSFYRLHNGSFSPSSFRSTFGEQLPQQRLLDDAYWCIANAIKPRRRQVRMEPGTNMEEQFDPPKRPRVITKRVRDTSPRSRSAGRRPGLT